MDLARIQKIIGDKDKKNKEVKKEEPPKKAGLKVYKGGKEKTPTGKSNAFVGAGVSEEQLNNFAKEFNLPTTSNKDFQEAAIALLEKTPQGKSKLAEINSKYGDTKAGTLADNILGARTVDIMSGITQNKAAREEDNRITGLSKHFVRTPEGLEYSYGDDKEGFNEYMKTHKISDKATRIQGQDLEKLKKRFPKLFNQEVDLQKFFRDNPGAY